MIVSIYKTGSGLIILEEDDRVFNDNIWHDVVLVHEDEAVHLMVDDQKYSTATSKPVDNIEVKDSICFGSGLSDKNFFVGSFGSKVELNGEIVDILTDSVSGMNIGNPEDNSTCDPYLCNSNGNCLETTENDHGFICNCFFGFQGMYCESGNP